MSEQATDQAVEVAARRPRGVARLLAGVVRGYQQAISPLLRPSCRFAPSCSDYAIESLLEHGVLRGSWLALCRLLRCHPFCAGGYDPVPPSARGTRGRPERVEADDAMMPAGAPAPIPVEPALVPALSSQEAGECPC